MRLRHSWLKKKVKKKKVSICTFDIKMMEKPLRIWISGVINIVNIRLKFYTSWIGSAKILHDLKMKITNWFMVKAYQLLILKITRLLNTALTISRKKTWL